MNRVKKIGSIFLIAILILMTATPAYVEASTSFKEICIGYKVQLSVNTKKSVTWVSSNKKVATVTKKGLVTGTGVGSALIVAKYGNTTTSWLFKVIPAEEEIVYEYDVSKPRGITLSKKTLYIGKWYTLKLNGVEGKVKWESSDKSVATVTSKGEVTANKKGTAKVTATVNKKKYTCTITVIDKKLYADVSNLKMSADGRAVITITFNPDVEDNISLAIDKEDVISAEFGEWDGDDLPCSIKALSEGTANLTITTKYTKEKIVIPITVN